MGLLELQDGYELRVLAAEIVGRAEYLVKHTPEGSHQRRCATALVGAARSMEAAFRQAKSDPGAGVEVVEAKKYVDNIREILRKGGKL